MLQETIGKIWNRVNLADKTIKKANLPSSFRKMVMQDNNRMPVEGIELKWKVPKKLAEYYHRQGPFFETLRNYRDQISHHGHDFSFVFTTERGFAVKADMEPFASFKVWNERHMLPNRLASLRPIIAYVISETFRACEEFTEVIQKIIQFPPEIVPGFKLFLRGYYNTQLLGMKPVLEKCLWWDEQY